jgi:Protein of unknown function (DUF2752)
MEVDTAIANEAERISEDGSLLNEQPSKKLALFGFAGLFAVFLASLLLRPPATNYFTSCGFKNITGLPCPGCGLTHSFCALAKGNIVDACGFNLLGPVLFLALLVLWFRSAFVMLNVIKPVQVMDRIAGRLNIVRAFFVGFAVYGIVRIGYLLAYDPASFRDSPLSHFIASLIH